VGLAGCGRSNAAIANVASQGRHGRQVAAPVRRLPVGRPGRPVTQRPSRTFTALQRAEVKALACALPATRGWPLSRWTSADLAPAGIAESMSVSTVRRILTKDAIKPWQYRSWISVRDPNFQAKAARVLELLPAPPRRPSPRRRRVRHQQRGEDLHPSPLPLSPHDAARPRPTDARRARPRPRRRTGLPRRLGRGRRHRRGPMRRDHRHRAVPRPPRPSDEHRALPVSDAGH